MEKILITERLFLRKITLDDAPFMFELLNSPGWLEFIGDRGIRTISDAEKYIENHYLKSYKEYGYGSYLLIRNKDNAFLGICGLFHREQLDDVDIGFALLPEFHGKGYALEGTAALLKYAINDLNLKKILAITSIHNSKSQKLLKKIGLQSQGIIPFNEEEIMLFSN